MGNTPSFSPIYGKDENDKRDIIGISFGGQRYLGVKHPSEVKASTPKQEKPTTQSKSAKPKDKDSKKKSRK